MAFITLKPGIYEFIGSLSDFVDIKVSLIWAIFISLTLELIYLRMKTFCTPNDRKAYVFIVAQWGMSLFIGGEH